jgi:hypothetical protein
VVLRRPLLQVVLAAVLCILKPQLECKGPETPPGTAASDAASQEEGIKPAEVGPLFRSHHIPRVNGLVCAML